MKSFLFKYDADPRDEDLKDELGLLRCGGKGGVRDPDFWSNEFPVWAICGPYYRASLRKGDVVFFVPKMSSVRMAGLRDLICSGFLVVAEKVPDANSVMMDDRLTNTYRERYKADLIGHLKNDRPRTRIIRQQNFIVGDRTRSRWLGRSQEHLGVILADLGLHDLAKKLSCRRIPSLNENQTRKLYEKLHNARK
jgi:hypothetical protein